jgi:hypothetical protein
MVDEVPVTPPTPAPAPWWTKLYQPAMLSAIAMLITAIGGVVSVLTAKTLRNLAKEKKEK